MADMIEVARRERLALLGDALGLGALCAALVSALHALPVV